jgi:hypothetical protein
MRRTIAVAAALAFIACDNRPGGLTGVTPLNLPATQLVIVAQPSDEAVATNITPVIQVALRNASGQTVTTGSANLSVIITPGTGTAGAVLTGTTINNPTSGGVAVFSDLKIDRAGTGYTLTFSAIGLTSAVSTAFNIQ